MVQSNKFNFNFLKEMQAYRRACMKGNHSEWLRTFRAGHQDVLTNENLRNDFYHYLKAQRSSNIFENVCFNALSLPLTLGFTMSILSTNWDEITKAIVFVGVAGGAIFLIVPEIHKFTVKKAYIDDILSSIYGEKETNE